MRRLGRRLRWTRPAVAWRRSGSSFIPTTTGGCGCCLLGGWVTAASGLESSVQAPANSQAPLFPRLSHAPSADVTRAAFMLDYCAAPLPCPPLPTLPHSFPAAHVLMRLEQAAAGSWPLHTGLAQDSRRLLQVGSFGRPAGIMTACTWGFSALRINHSTPMAVKCCCTPRLPLRNPYPVSPCTPVPYVSSPLPQAMVAACRGSHDAVVRTYEALLRWALYTCIAAVRCIYIIKHAVLHLCCARTRAG